MTIESLLFWLRQIETTQPLITTHQKNPLSLPKAGFL
jgi:hypothetical protein